LRERGERGEREREEIEERRERSLGGEFVWEWSVFCLCYGVSWFCL